MAGQLQTILPKTEFNFKEFAQGTTDPIPMGAPVDALDYPDGVMIIRVHALNFPADNSLIVGLYPDGSLGSDSQFFGNTALSSVTLVGGFVVPSLRTFGAVLLSQYVTLGLVVVRTGTSPMTATLSVDIALRSPDDAVAESAEPAGAQM
jgi:hypothetical protein